MEPSKGYENYPIRIVLLSNIVSLGIDALGFFIILRLGLVYSLIYLFYLIILEYRLMKSGCISCYYWGKRCAFGKGKLSSYLFKKGDTKRFCAKEMTWKDMIPDIMVSLIPLSVGIILLIINFDLVLLIAILLLVLLTTSGNGYVRGTLACNNCKQKETGCPAYMLFNKNKKSD